MRDAERLLRRVAGCLVVLMVLQCAEMGIAQAQQAAGASAPPAAPKQGGEGPAASAETASAAPGPAEESGSYPDAPVAQSQSTPSDSNQTAGAQGAQQNGDAKPLGTAAAPYSRPSGVTGSRPAGAVIAPGKQHRVHALLISLGIVAGAAIAVGTVAALSRGTPSRP